MHADEVRVLTRWLWFLRLGMACFLGAAAFSLGGASILKTALFVGAFVWFAVRHARLSDHIFALKLRMKLHVKAPQD